MLKPVQSPRRSADTFGCVTPRTSAARTCVTYAETFPAEAPIFDPQWYVGSGNALV